MSDLSNDPVASFRAAVTEEVPQAEAEARAAREAREARLGDRLHDAIAVLLLLVAFPFGLALMALATVFGRSLPRALTVGSFMAAVHAVALVQALIYGRTVGGVLAEGGGLLRLMLRAAGVEV